MPLHAAADPADDYDHDQDLPDSYTIHPEPRDDSPHPCPVHPVDRWRAVCNDCTTFHRHENHARANGQTATAPTPVTPWRTLAA